MFVTMWYWQSLIYYKQFPQYYESSSSEKFRDQTQILKCFEFDVAIQDTSLCFSKIGFGIGFSNSKFWYQVLNFMENPQFTEDIPYH